jgi:hypothetical protein
VKGWFWNTGPPAWLSTIEARTGTGSGLTVMMVSSGMAVVVTRGLPIRSSITAPALTCNCSVPVPPGVTETVKTAGLPVALTLLMVAAGLAAFSKSSMPIEEAFIGSLKVTV